MDKEERQMSSSYSVRGIEKLINNFIFLTTVLYTSKEFVGGPTVTAMYRERFSHMWTYLIKIY